MLSGKWWEETHKERRGSWEKEGKRMGLMLEEEHVEGDGVEESKKEENVFWKRGEIFVWFVMHEDFFEGLVIFSGLALEIFEDVWWMDGEKRGLFKD